MRQIATLLERDAHKLADYLLTLHIETRLLPEGGSVGVWVCNEDLLPRARSEVAEFLKEPNAPRYAEAARSAQELRRREEEADAAVERRQEELARRMAQGASANPPVLTIGLILASLAVSVAAGTAMLLEGPLPLSNPVLRAVLIAAPDQPGLAQIRHGEVWRLLTPIFLHFGPLHLLFNLLMLRDLGGAVEARRGSLRLLGLVLLLAVPSNLGQYYWDHNPFFGGMSGVLYGLFGYAWMKSRLAPELGLLMPPNVVAFLIGWFFLCLAGVLPNVANVAHAVGLATGIVIGAAPHLLRPRREG